MRQFLLDPFGDSCNAGRIFESPYGVLRDKFAGKGIQLDTCDQGDLSKAEKVLFFNYNSRLYRTCLSLGLSRDRLVLFVFEPYVVIPKQHTNSVWNNFGTIFTHDDSRVDGKRVFKLRYPQAKSLIHGTPTFRERKSLVLINANKYSYEKGELYSLRRDAIRYFEQHEPGFDLYGYGWNAGLGAFSKGNMLRAVVTGKPHRLVQDALSAFSPYKSYRGIAEDKNATMGHYRFCICYENEAQTPGYITEKIFDCFVTGTVPIYLGAPNITEYIPVDAFVDMRKFSSFDDLRSCLNSLKEHDVFQMQKAAAEYLQSPAFNQWQPGAVFGSIVEVLS